MNLSMEIPKDYPDFVHHTVCATNSSDYPPHATFSSTLVFHPFLLIYCILSPSTMMNTYEWFISIKNSLHFS
jgi:hypothetical protein